MKRLFNLTIAALASVFALASCQNKEEEPVIPATLSTEFTNLEKVSTDTKDGITTIVLKASTAEASIDITVLSPKVYLEAGSYTVGKASGNYSAHYKDKLVDCDVVSGGLTVAVDADENYTLTGALKLSNEQGTILKLTAKGKIEFPAPAEWVYTKTTEDGATVYSIYTIGEVNELVAMATVFGETGEFAVSAAAKDKGTAKIGNSAVSGTFISEPAYGYFMQLSGKVTVTPVKDKMQFVFDGNRDVTYNNCELIAKANVVTKKSPTEPDANGAKFTYKYFSVPSELVEGAIEFTAKVYYAADNSEFISMTSLRSNDTFWKGEGQGKGHGTMVYPMAYYSEALIDKLAIQETCYYVIDGKHYTVPTELYCVINDKSETKGYAMVAPIDGSYNGPAELMDWLTANDMTIWSLVAFVRE